MEYYLYKRIVTEVPVETLIVNAGVRYFEDGTVNGQEDDNDNPKIYGAAMTKGEWRWYIEIDLKSGKILDWPEGMTAKVHYKVCDDGVYTLVNKEGEKVSRLEHVYVPRMLSPGGDGFGDYIIMDIDGEGTIDNWEVCLTDWEGIDDEI